MPFRVFEVRPKDGERLEDALHDDVVSRQSITIRTAKHFGYEDRDTLFVVIEGSDTGLLRADALILEFGRRAKDADDIHARLKAEEDEAASGLGFILGD